ncbi:ParA family protein [Actinokineospora bangkokensis]|uniref:Chromosome partitioning protein n=1 Tax=Actinokineospora bangkokensis TaxID=1193682 RepID=A0A1Q9LHG2_9PSEU|nr:AAA family ATPase [Actinokineospora bangkokensis]OLR91478.1 chromosome partitioning protein [Actinokineospora bangkokensis]
MTTPVIAFFNNKGGVGKTSLLYHVAWMMADLGHRVVVADLDPQANLTSAFLDEGEIEALWSDRRRTVWGAIKPFQEGSGVLAEPRLTSTGDDRLALLAGDLDLSTFEDDLSSSWPKCLDGDARSFRIISTFSSVLQQAAQLHGAEFVLVDVGPSLGAINRAALVASDHVVIPVAPDLFSLQGLKNLGPTLRKWRRGWGQRLDEQPRAEPLQLPGGTMAALGYVVLQHSVRLDRPVRAYQRWVDQIPSVFHSAVLNTPGTAPSADDDPMCLGRMKNYRSLMPLAQEARKPIFHLTTADGALGGHLKAARETHGHFAELTQRIIGGIGSESPDA